MYTRFPRQAALRLAASLALAGALAACGTSATAPEPEHRARTTAGVSRDDDPPDLPCRSGWQMQDGVWVCPS